MAIRRCRRCGERKLLPYLTVSFVDPDKMEERYFWCRECLEEHAADLIGVLPLRPEEREPSAPVGEQPGADAPVERPKELPF